MLDWLNSPYFFFLTVILAGVALYRLKKRSVKKASRGSWETPPAACTASPGRAPEARFLDALRASVARDGWEPGLKLSAPQTVPPLRPHLSGVDVLAPLQNTEGDAADPENVAQAISSSSGRKARSVWSNALGILSSVEIKSIQRAGALQVFGLKWAAGDGLDYSTLDEALLARTLDVAEINGPGQVPAIKVENRSWRMVFLMAGELLVGCKQDRALNTSIMVPSRAKCPFP